MIDRRFLRQSLIIILHAGPSDIFVADALGLF